jgi:hypothetical protein
MKKVFLFCLLTLPCLSVCSQSIIVEGSVFVSGEEELAGYNVILLNQTDSSFYKGDFFLEPEFKVNVEEDKLPLFLKISSLGYKDTILYVDKNQWQFADIRLEVETSQIIPGVIVRGTIPLYTAKKDRITMNVSNTILSQAGTAMDVLHKAARVKIDNNGISVLGVGNAILIVDGRVLPSYQIAESMPSSDIEKIDIITNPSAKYDASGKAVIEITTRKAINEGWGGEVNMRLGKGKDWRTSSGGTFSAKYAKFSFLASYTFAPSKRLNNETYKYDSPDDGYFVVNDRQTKLNHKNNHTIRLASDYNFSPAHALGVQFNGQMRDTYKDIYNSNNLSQSNHTSAHISIHDGILNRTYLSGTAYYSYTPASKKSSLHVLYDKSLFHTKDITDINENQTLKNNHVGTDIQIDALQIDYTLNLSGNWQLNAGGKYAYMANASTTIFTNNGIENRYIDYDYKEKTGAFYFLLSRKIKKLNYEFGARMEASNSQAQTNSQVIYERDTEYNLFPDLSLTYQLPSDLSLSASYTMKISRPTFQDMNPAIDYIDSLSYFQGNPDLTPEKQHSLGMKLSYKSYASIGFTYTRRNNQLAWYVEPDKETPVVAKVTQKNIDKSDVYTVDLVVPYPTKWFLATLATGVIWTNTNDKTENIVNLNKPMWYLYGGFNANLPYNFRFNTTINYFTKGVENIFYFDPVFRMDISLQRNFFNNKLSASLLWNDVFSSDKMNTYTTLKNRHILYHYYFDQSVVQLSLTYRFRAAKAGYRSKSAIDAEKNRIKGLQ